MPAIGTRRKLRKHLTAFVCICAVPGLIAGAAAGQDRQLFERGRDHWQGTRYGKAYPDLREYRRGFQGRTPIVDYMIGTSACRIDEHKRFGFRTTSSPATRSTT